MERVATRSAGSLNGTQVALDKHHELCSRDHARKLRRVDRLRARRALRSLSQLPRVRSCGLYSRLPDGEVTAQVTVTPDGPRAGFGGLIVCGSVWACPWCSAKIMAGRSEELEEAIRAWTERGGSWALVTLTVRHHAGQSLEQVWNAVADAWRAVTGHRSWREYRRRYGIAGYVRVVEVTHGANGWHVHLHVLVAIVGDPSVVYGLGEVMYERWALALAARGFSAVRDAQDFRPVVTVDAALGDYLAKAVYRSAAIEVTGAGLKQARRGNRTPFQILAGFLATGDAEDLALWHEWERVSRGRRQWTWSRGFRVALGLGEIATDEELADAALGGDEVFRLPAESWTVLRDDPDRLAVLLDVIEADPTGVLARWQLDVWGIAWKPGRSVDPGARGAGAPGRLAQAPPGTLRAGALCRQSVSQ